MKKVYLVVIVFGFLVGAFGAWNIRGGGALSPQGRAAFNTSFFTAPTPVPVPDPARLVIPKLEVDVPIESVQQDAVGRMATPSNWYDTGWYSYGPKPGEPGQAVINGHFDTPTGPATFYKLSELQSGDEVVVIDRGGGKHTFNVFSKAVYSDAAFPVDLVFGPNQDYGLNLITCEGVFNRQTKNYSDRLVVFTKLIE